MGFYESSVRSGIYESPAQVGWGSRPKIGSDGLTDEERARGRAERAQRTDRSQSPPPAAMRAQGGPSLRFGVNSALGFLPGDGNFPPNSFRVGAVTVGQEPYAAGRAGISSRSRYDLSRGPTDPASNVSGGGQSPDQQFSEIKELLIELLGAVRRMEAQSKKMAVLGAFLNLPIGLLTNTLDRAIRGGD